MGQKVIRALAYLLLVGTSLVIPAGHAAADSATITLESQKVFRNLAEPGDMAIVFHGNWSGNTSAYPASSTVSISISYNGTIVATAAPYVFSPFGNNGYGDGITGFYFSANSSPVYGGNYTIQITGLPAYYSTYSPPAIFTYTLQPADFETSADQDQNQSDLKIYILNQCDIFASIYPSAPLKGTSASGTVLSGSYGEAYFDGAFPGLRVLVPSLYYVMIVTPALMPVSSTNSSLASSSSLIDGTDLKRGADRLGALINVSGYFIWGLFSAGLCLFVMFKFSKKGWQLEAALFVGLLIILGMSLIIGNMLTTIVLISSFLAAIGIGWAIWGKRG